MLDTTEPPLITWQVSLPLTYYVPNMSENPPAYHHLQQGFLVPGLLISGRLVSGFFLHWVVCWSMLMECGFCSLCKEVPVTFLGGYVSRLPLALTLLSRIGLCPAWILLRSLIVHKFRGWKSVFIMVKFPKYLELCSGHSAVVSNGICQEFFV